MMLSERELDVLRECASAGSDRAASALSMMVGGAVDISVLQARTAALGELAAVQEHREGVRLGIRGALDGATVMLLEPAGVDVVSGLLGLPPGDELAPSAVSEVANVMAAQYLIALGELSGVHSEPGPPEPCSGTVEAIVGALGDDATALLLDSRLAIDGAAAEMTFLLMPRGDGVTALLRGLGAA